MLKRGCECGQVLAAEVVDEVPSHADQIRRPGCRRKMIGTLTGLGVAVALAGAATPAEAQSQGSHGAPSGSGSGSRLWPRQVAAAFYASYNGDLAAGFERYISKDLVLHGFDGPNERSAWGAGDLELKASLTGYRLDVFDQIAEGTKVVTRWSLGGVHTGTILGIPRPAARSTSAASPSTAWWAASPSSTGRRGTSAGSCRFSVARTPDTESLLRPRARKAREVGLRRTGIGDLGAAGNGVVRGLGEPPAVLRPRLVDPESTVSGQGPTGPPRPSTNRL